MFLTSPIMCLFLWFNGQSWFFSTLATLAIDFLIAFTIYIRIAVEFGKIVIVSPCGIIQSLNEVIPLQRLPYCVAHCCSLTDCNNADFVDSCHLFDWLQQCQRLLSCVPLRGKKNLMNSVDCLSQLPVCGTSGEL